MTIRTWGAYVALCSVMLLRSASSQGLFPDYRFNQAAGTTSVAVRAVCSVGSTCESWFVLMWEEINTGLGQWHYCHLSKRR